MAHFDEQRAVQLQVAEQQRRERKQVALDQLKPVVETLKARLNLTQYVIEREQHQHLLQKWHELNALIREYYEELN